jgi:ATP-dependent Clp protease ATP-binding subunit ClpX
VELQFTEGAIKAVARRAALMKTGARALRTILEDVMLDVMYEVPARDGVKSILINEDTIAGLEVPQMLS